MGMQTIAYIEMYMMSTSTILPSNATAIGIKNRTKTKLSLLFIHVLLSSVTNVNDRSGTMKRRPMVLLSSHSEQQYSH